MLYKPALCLLITMTTISMATAHCRDFWTSFRGHCYQYFEDKKVPWHIAEHRCNAVATSDQQGHLVSIHDEEEDQFVASLTAKSSDRAKRGPPVWIGLHYKPEERRFAWVDNSDRTRFAGWRGSPPPHREDKYCVVINSPYRADWNDQNCATDRGYVCKMPSALTELHHFWRRHWHCYWCYVQSLNKTIISTFPNIAFIYF